MCRRDSKGWGEADMKGPDISGWGIFNLFCVGPGATESFELRLSFLERFLSILAKESVGDTYC
jgi:hypothetical protein